MPPRRNIWAADTWRHIRQMKVGAMKSEVLLICPRELIDRWFTILEDHGFSIAVSPNTSPESFEGLDPVAYRSAKVIDDKAAVTIWTHPGKKPDADDQLAGKYLVVLQFPAWTRKKLAANHGLAARIKEVLVSAGMTVFQSK